MTAGATYRIWTSAAVRGAVALDVLTGLEDAFRLRNGEPLADGFPGDVRWAMDAGRPNDLLFLDVLPNRKRVIVVSERLAECIASRQPPEVEFLPLRIVDHKGRIAKPVYRILNPLRPLACLDEAASVPKPLAVHPEWIASVERLVLDPSRIDPERLMFRVKGFDAATFVRADLAAAIEAGGFTGVRFTAPEDWRK